MECEQQVLSLATFTQMFASEYNYILEDNTIKTMKHALDLHIVNDIKYVAISKMMRFIIRLIEHIEGNSGAVYLHDILNSLSLSIKACFPYGKFTKNKIIFFNFFIHKCLIIF